MGYPDVYSGKMHEQKKTILVLISFFDVIQQFYFV